ncbi:hypothetical protein CRE_15006 [Caenorhabditis remanei]|uniref:Uncharacterized protein n=1 Tax=Caenorhabditis remanei TaxID=31234 RepID=E3NIQ4_CAERE|nr:hypothetical protein CRE_15006 [Caenorhabditis remanei]
MLSKILDNVARVMSAWLAVGIALYRLIIIRNALDSKFDSLSTLSAGLKTLLAVFLPLFLLEFFYRIQFKLAPNNWEFEEVCGYPANYTVVYYELKKDEDFKLKLLDKSTYDFVNAILRVMPALILPIVTFGLIREMRKGKAAMRKRMNSGAQESKLDNTTKVIIFMTIASIISESPYGTTYFLVLLLANNREYVFISMLILNCKPIFDIFVSLNTMSHCFISLAISTQYKNAVVATFLPITSKFKKPENTIRVTQSRSLGDSVSNNMSQRRLASNVAS